MRLRSIFACILAGLLFVSPAYAQVQPDQWRSYAERLGPHSLVVVQLSTGARVQGHIVQITDNEISVLPKTRIPVPVRHLPLSEIQSIEVQKDGWSPGAKVLTGVGSVAGVLMVVVIAMLANYR